jgi:hypothetical protein
MTFANEEETLKVISRANAVANRITGKSPGSLGLLPAVYFYSQNARHQPTSVLAMSALVIELDKTDKFNEFTRVRAAFEQFLAENKAFINQLTVRHGSMAKGYRQQKEYLMYVLDSFISGETSEKIITNMKEHVSYRSLTKELPIKTQRAKSFSDELTKWKFMSTALEQAKTCDLCEARLDNKSMQLGHKIDKKDGGLGSGDNAAWEHPYCNSTYKPYLQKLGKI